ncbi:hypothetical protein [Pseudomonas eucalypticola]|uniref:DUF4410 domain-containing protein n=1 Tax=Pseudomonas eucalypticola TaxID=2599595 RepID=A0A7D5H192_9PSED|nr:hypothetical protein [Pseudomonas eucalypticola]QKZ05507.1 hypothetical protein HWQ56_17575 [Pseudomonas eucalypticola]
MTSPRILASTLFLATAVVALSGHAATLERPSTNEGYHEISIFDIPFKDQDRLEDAMTSAHLLRASTGPAAGPSAEERAQIERRLRERRKPSTYVETVDNASMVSRLVQVQRERPARKLASPQGMYDAPRLSQTRQCEVQVSYRMGVYTENGLNGLRRYLHCPDGDLLLQDMVLKGVAVTTIKELANVDLAGHRGMMYGMRDASGNSYTRLTWVSNNTHHLADKAGTTPQVRNWLLGYGRELVAQGR